MRSRSLVVLVSFLIAPAIAHGADAQEPITVARGTTIGRLDATDRQTAFGYEDRVVFHARRGDHIAVYSDAHAVTLTLYDERGFAGTGGVGRADDPSRLDLAADAGLARVYPRTVGRDGAFRLYITGDCDAAPGRGLEACAPRTGRYILYVGATPPDAAALQDRLRRGDGSRVAFSALIGSGAGMLWNGSDTDRKATLNPTASVAVGYTTAFGLGIDIAGTVTMPYPRHAGWRQLAAIAGPRLRWELGSRMVAITGGLSYLAAGGDDPGATTMQPVDRTGVGVRLEYARHRGRFLGMHFLQAHVHEREPDVDGIGGGRVGMLFYGVAIGVR